DFSSHSLLSHTEYYTDFGKGYERVRKIWNYQENVPTTYVEYYYDGVLSLPNFDSKLSKTATYDPRIGGNLISENYYHSTNRRAGEEVLYYAYNYRVDGEGNNVKYTTTVYWYQGQDNENCYNDINSSIDWAAKANSSAVNKYTPYFATTTYKYSVITSPTQVSTPDTWTSGHSHNSISISFYLAPYHRKGTETLIEIWDFGSTWQSDSGGRMRQTIYSYHQGVTEPVYNWDSASITYNPLKSVKVKTGEINSASQSRVSISYYAGAKGKEILDYRANYDATSNSLKGYDIYFYANVRAGSASFSAANNQTVGYDGTYLDYQTVNEYIGCGRRITQSTYRTDWGKGNELLAHSYTYISNVLQDETTYYYGYFVNGANGSVYSSSSLCYDAWGVNAKPYDPILKSFYEETGGKHTERTTYYVNKWGKGKEKVYFIRDLNDDNRSQWVNWGPDHAVFGGSRMHGTITYFFYGNNQTANELTSENTQLVATRTFGVWDLPMGIIWEGGLIIDHWVRGEPTPGDLVRIGNTFSFHGYYDAENDNHFNDDTYDVYDSVDNEWRHNRVAWELNWSYLEGEAYYEQKTEEDQTGHGYWITVEDVLDLLGYVASLIIGWVLHYVVVALDYVGAWINTNIIKPVAIWLGLSDINSHASGLAQDMRDQQSDELTYLIDSGHNVTVYYDPVLKKYITAGEIRTARLGCSESVGTVTTKSPDFWHIVTGTRYRINLDENYKPTGIHAAAHTLQFDFS
ncbi:MAG TPA: hypothetical protein PLV52_04735, partial [Candidatus Omnitrophota bacterium]|nr:hypothetical protein [Candidatus Omnitrophota bacterium]